MKILFICGTLEPEMDGVGDYARRLAGELLKRGNDVYMVSFYDHFTEKFKEEIQEQENSIIPVLRLGAGEKEKFRIEKTRELIDRYAPEWVSVQYVPYSFDYRGFPYTLSRRLKGLGTNLKWHIMFHELWVESKKVDSFKQQITGFFQKLIIKRMLHHLSPVISTNLPIYSNRLGIENISLLPLFGNIPFHPINKVNTQKNMVTVVHFGGFTGNLKDFETQLIWLRQFAKFRRKKIELILIGGGGVFKDRAVSIAGKILGENAIKDLGRLRCREISEIFQKADLGMSRANFNNYCKSGSTISMLEHGLPVILRGEPNRTTLHETRGYENLLTIHDDPKNEYKRTTSFSNLEETSKLFCSILNQTVNHSIKSFKTEKSCIPN